MSITDGPAFLYAHCRTERLLAGRHEHHDRILALAALHLARGAWPDAAADQLTADHALPVLHARTELVRGRVAEAFGETPKAITAYQAGLRTLAPDEWPLI